MIQSEEKPVIFSIFSSAYSPFRLRFFVFLLICVDSVCQKDQSTDECKHTEEKNSCGITGLNGVGSLDDFRLGNGIAYFYLFHCKVHTKLCERVLITIALCLTFDTDGKVYGSGTIGSKTTEVEIFLG